jgi:KTSC domain
MTDRKSAKASYTAHPNHQEEDAPKTTEKAKWVDVDGSSRVKRFIYGAAEQILIVDYTNGRYGYSNITAKEYAALLKAKSKGEAMEAIIEKHPGTRLQEGFSN